MKSSHPSKRSRDLFSALSRRGFLKGATAVGLTFPLIGCGEDEAAQASKELNFYNWDTYIGETTLDDFKEASGITVKMDLFSDNDELFAKLKDGNPGYDVIVPTNDFVERFIAADMLVELDQSKIPNVATLSDAFKDAAFDPGRKFSLPYMWGTMGIGYRKSAVRGVPTSWKVMFDSDEYSGRIALMSESSTVLGMVMKYNGKSLNSANPTDLKQAEDMLIAQKPHVKVFAEDNGQDLLLSGEVDLAIEWNGDILQVQEESDDIAYVVPDEGSLVWEDTLCIPKGAPNVENAHAFINYILDADVGASIADFIQYATPNAAAKAKMAAEYTDNPAIFPTDEVLARCEPIIYKGEDVTRMYNETWTRVQAA